ncbi:hypothetical protein M5W83_04075 [Paenibacillus thiaminolyticus]|jgi:hypothetical protein|uniref:Signal transduction histidine kinase n=1 Tax=Paenibacillus thiaminolyticus TaxID=49283 RepID=A0A378ZJJ9_PANTH|nr:hypothetical protein [Paenibacillus thiaminolyticus]MCY9533450.1 hypothetical protein [Paenibacillus thiaminolyticus]MCY9604115.1 hypothetical protein [Paenibacillus thiaminolyticus]MCY9606337.1 hypothetical protein [Paenibacillus thiaminolyticus]MCY9612087.1 hypothetical protein [Paenibacillus thiaminolyticus]MCY9618108.1 hypothetical protein [Paenibacillus thiaminolyticus]
MNSSTNIIFIILAFSLGAILVWKKDSVPPALRRPMAIAALLFLVFAFFLVVYSFWTAGT